MENHHENSILSLFRISLTVFTLLSNLFVQLSAQEVLNSFEVQGGAWTDCYESMVRDHSGNFYVGFNRLTWKPAVIKDSLLYGYRNDTSDLGLSDFYYVKFNKDLKISNSFVIDNAEHVMDIYSSDSISVISMNLDKFEKEDSLYPILINGEIEVERTGNRGKGILCVLNNELGLKNVMMPSNGGIGQIACDNKSVYVELIIPDQAPYIIIGNDTIQNWELGIGGLDYGFQTIVLCKYNLLNNQLEWTRRIGGAGIDFLRDMIIDSEGTLLIHGWTSSGVFHFTDADSSINYQENKPFIAKYSNDGDLIWSKLNTNQHGEEFHEIQVDSLDNVYYLGEYLWPEYHIGDTILYNHWLLPNNPTNRALVVKYDKNGDFKWAFQYDGEFASSNVRDISVSKDNEVVISGWLFDGEIFLGGSEYINHGITGALIVVKLDGKSGQYSSHLVEQGPSYKAIQNLYYISNNELVFYFEMIGDENVFNHNFHSYHGDISAFIVSLKDDFTSANTYSNHINLDISIYPNPMDAGEIINVDVPYEFTNTRIYYQIHDLSGKQMQDGIIENQSPNFQIRSKKELFQQGLYMLTLVRDDQTFSSLLVVK